MLHQLLNSMDSYLLGMIALSDLEDWLVSNLQEILDSGEQQTIDIANHLDADIVEFGEGLIEVPTLNERLLSYILDAQTVSIDYGELPLVPDVDFISSESAANTVWEKYSITLVETYRADAVFA